MSRLRRHNDLHRGRRHCIDALSFVGLALLPALAAAQASQATAPGPWRFGASLYVYLPSVKGTSSAPADSGGTPIDVNLAESIEFAAMGSLDAHNGRWGIFTDLVKLNLGGNKHQSRDFTLGNAEIPAGTTADLDWTLKGTVLTFAGQYRVLADPAVTVDALAGLRWFDVRTTTSWSISGSLGPLLPDGRSGQNENKSSVFDGIVGFKGRAALGSPGSWSVPFYLDVGTGESKLTWQAAAGISYSFGWGEVNALWRHLSYEMKSGDRLKDVSFSGPMVGATWRW